MMMTMMMMMMMMIMMMKMKVGSVLSSMHLRAVSPGSKLLTGEDLNVLYFPEGLMCIQSSPMCLMSCLLAMVVPPVPGPLSHLSP